jgi:hypothetical protein
MCKAVTQNMYNIKYINAQQAKTVSSFKNIKEKLSKINAAIKYAVYVFVMLSP